MISVVKWIKFSYLEDLRIWKTSFLNYSDNWNLTLILGQIILT